MSTDPAAVDLLAALERVIGTEQARRATRRPRHPETGCPCKSCDERDERLEAIAERRADDRDQPYRY